MSFFSALRWMLGFGAHLLYLILRLLFGVFKGAKEVDNVGTSVDEEKLSTGNEPRSAKVFERLAQPEGTYSSRMNVASGELFYPGGLIDRRMPADVSRSTPRGPPSHPVVQVGRETVHIQLRGTRRRILSSDSSTEEDKEEKEKDCPTGGCAPKVKSLISSRVVVPLSNVISERTLTTVEKREERKADVRLSIVSKKTELQSDQEALAPLPEAVRYDRAPIAEPLAASSGRPLKSHRDQVLEQVRKCRSIVQALTTTSAGGLSKAQRMFSSRKLRAASAPWANRASGGDESDSCVINFCRLYTHAQDDSKPTDDEGGHAVGAVKWVTVTVGSFLDLAHIAFDMQGSMGNKNISQKT
ncbi:hypothetical protein TTRE_0000091901 [Trichuris trichiura]|uniref:Uncharacterized protein n=1 Tax=Trichuris trichiura TaxID=36087 RepID=A0A077YXB4_TRITR|nr:hypothetical protein TTRE_0000091901 [Trichuris trichiura]